MKKKRSRVGCLFWIALILLLVVVFLFNRKTISNVIESTGFKKIITKQEKTDSGTPPEVVRQTEKNDTSKTGEDSKLQILEITPSESSPEGNSEKKEIPTKDEVKKDTEKRVVQEEAPEKDSKLRNAKLYFIDVGESGTIKLQAVVRPVYFHDSPLTETLAALLQGLLPSELNMELITLVPENTKLISVRVEKGTAYLNFNEAFRFNSLGLEGYVAQLKQVVFTATEFPTVERVQILINGAKHEYLGPEGVFIGQPLTRNSFNEQATHAG